MIFEHIRDEKEKQTIWRISITDSDLAQLALEDCAALPISKFDSVSNKLIALGFVARKIEEKK